MGGSVGDAFAALDPGRLARQAGIDTSPVENYYQTVGASLDPGGLVYTAQDKKISDIQSKLDVGGYGAKKTVALREATALANAQTAAAAKAAAKEAGLVRAQQGIAAETKRRLDERRRRMIERGSLMYSMDQQGGNTLG